MLFSAPVFVAFEWATILHLLLYAVAKLFEVLFYKPEGRGFDS
jgi:hypothetical protein